MGIKKALIAGHICLDACPDLSEVPGGQFNVMLQPGQMIRANGIKLTTGGAVPNTGLALHKLGLPVRLIGKIGKDLFGQAIQDILSQESPDLVGDLILDPSVPTAFTIVLNPPGVDRMFIHAHGANDTFYASDLPREALQAVDLFHFGYPTLMRSIYRGGGGELVSILIRARRAGLTTGLDFSLPDPSSPAAKVDWPSILANALPYVDLFMPSVQELLFLLNRSVDAPHSLESVSPALLNELSEIILGYGVKVVLVKLGHRGIYLRTGKLESWKKTGRGLEDLDDSWHNRELWMPAFEVTVKGTCGAGDAAVAGFLGGILRGTDPMTAMTMASATGACSVEALDSTSGILPWEAIYRRVKAGWQSHMLDLQNEGWVKETPDGPWQKERH